MTAKPVAQLRVFDLPGDGGEGLQRHVIAEPLHGAAALALGTHKLYAAETAGLPAMYVSGPYQDGHYAICELASGRVLQRLEVGDFPVELERHHGK